MRFTVTERLGIQVTKMCEYAKAHNYNVKKVVTENRSGVSPISDDFYNLIKNPKIDFVIVPALASITRNYMNFVELEKKVKELHKSIICLDGNIIQ